LFFATSNPLGVKRSSGALKSERKQKDSTSSLNGSGYFYCL
jgi:hypothetical protein